MTEPYKLIGKPVPRVDAVDKLKGKAAYAEDMSFPGMLYLKVLRSDRPHARIVKIHIEKAETYPGVAAVLTSKDIPGRNRVGLITKDQRVLCDDKVRFIGDPVAMVAAETLEAAEAAIPLIRIDYDDLPGIFSPEAALAPDAVKIHETGNLLVDRNLSKGDFDRAIEQADVVIRNTYRTGTVQHACLEAGAGVATYDGEKMTVWMPSKEHFTEHQEISAFLGIFPEKVRVICPEIGGAFGDNKRGLAPATMPLSPASRRRGLPKWFSPGRNAPWFPSNVIPLPSITPRPQQRMVGFWASKPTWSAMEGPMPLTLLQS